MATNKLTPPAFTNTQAVRAHLETWLGWVNEWHAADAQKRADAYNQRMIENGQPRLAVADPSNRGSTWYRGRLVLDSGRKYLRISNSWTGQAFAFVRAADGAILRAAGHRPVLNKIRGWIWVEDLTTWIHEYGVRYLPKTGSAEWCGMDEEAPQTWPAPGPQPEPTKGWMDQQCEEEDAEADAQDAAEAEWFAGLNAARAEVGLEPYAFLEPTEEPEPEPEPEDRNREVTITVSELGKIQSTLTALCAIVSLDHDGARPDAEQAYLDHGTLFVDAAAESKKAQRWWLDRARDAVQISQSVIDNDRHQWNHAGEERRAVAVKRHEVAALRSSVNALLGVLAERSGTPTRDSEEVFAGVYRTRRLEKGSGAAVGDFLAECRQVMDQTEGILD